MRILVVDDDEAVLDSLKTILQLDGHEVLSADCGQTGMAMFAAALSTTEPFEAVITDLTMPDMDGKQLAHCIKRLSPSTPIVILTGQDNGKAEGSSAFKDIDYILGKPLGLAALRKAMSECATLWSARAA